LKALNRLLFVASTVASWRVIAAASI
jgi:hypothetical protein